MFSAFFCARLVSICELVCLFVHISAIVVGFLTCLCPTYELTKLLIRIVSLFQSDFFYIPIFSLSFNRSFFHSLSLFVTLSLFVCLLTHNTSNTIYCIYEKLWKWKKGLYDNKTTFIVIIIRFFVLRNNGLRPIRFKPEMLFFPMYKHKTIQILHSTRPKHFFTLVDFSTLSFSLYHPIFLFAPPPWHRRSSLSVSLSSLLCFSFCCCCRFPAMFVLRVYVIVFMCSCMANMQAREKYKRANESNGMKGKKEPFQVERPFAKTVYMYMHNRKRSNNSNNSNSKQTQR